MKETSKAIARRLADPLFMRATRGHGIDIGAGTDPLNANGEFGADCVVDAFDRKDGDANRLDKCVVNESYDFIYSSHCLEHMDSWKIALRAWLRVLKWFGYGVIMVPDFDLYEQRQWPSKWAGEGHRWAFTLGRPDLDVPELIPVLPMLYSGASFITPISIRLCDAGYRYDLHDIDQSAFAETGIEIIFQKTGQ